MSHTLPDLTTPTRDDFLSDLVMQLVDRRTHMNITQEELDGRIGHAERLVSKWECGDRTPTGFNLYCWAQALGGTLVFQPYDPE